MTEDESRRIPFSTPAERMKSLSITAILVLLITVVTLASLFVLYFMLPDF
ncbi:hypothetical protein [Komagataeibacter sp. FNDCR2]|nr:hypothetical protein [Komagataeibacter sp. FNDCR2]MCE2576295.1 hypothetical protein [Komagataeibacter sp. FNDCR2]